MPIERDAMDETPPYFAVVRRGNAEVFDFLWQRAPGPRLVEVIWDRRVAERRSAARPVDGERRREDRRHAPPLSWSTLGFVLAPWQVRRGDAPPSTG